MSQIINFRSFGLPADVFQAARVIYSLRNIGVGYSGSAIRVRESAGDTELDIGFTGTELDTTALLAHTGTGPGDNGFVTKWYDQSGNSTDVVQTTNSKQPKIVSAGVIHEIGGSTLKPAVRYDSSNLTVLAAPTTSISPSFTAITYVEQDSGDAGYFIAGNPTTNTIFGGGSTLFLFYDGNTRLSIARGTNTNPEIRTGVFSTQAGASTIDVNNTNIATGGTAAVAGLNLLSLGAHSAGIGSLTFDGLMSETIIYDSDVTSTLSKIRTNMNGFYDIF